MAPARPARRILTPVSALLARHDDDADIDAFYVVTIGGITVTGQVFAAITQESSEFLTEPMDGIMGMGLPALSNLQTVRSCLPLLCITMSLSLISPKTPFFYTAMKQGIVVQNTFAFKLAQSGSELTLGGTNNASFTGEIEFHPLSSDAGYWIIGGGSVTVGGQTSASQIQTIIDSGSTIITAPTADADAFWQNVQGAQAYEQGLYTFPCDSAPEVALSWGGKSWSISANEYVPPLSSITNRYVNSDHDITASTLVK